MKISEPAVSTRISDLPTPRLRARAIELASKYWQRPIEDHDVDKAFLWSDTTEKRAFWRFCEVGNWNKAKELQPDLFKPMDGKPHIKLCSCLPNEYTLLVDNYVDGYDLGELSHYDKAIDYCVEVTPEYYTTIQEAVDALYSFKRATDVAGEELICG